MVTCSDVGRTSVRVAEQAGRRCGSHRWSCAPSTLRTGRHGVAPRGRTQFPDTCICVRAHAYAVHDDEMNAGKNVAVLQAFRALHRAGEVQ